MSTPNASVMGKLFRAFTEEMDAPLEARVDRVRSDEVAKAAVIISVIGLTCFAFWMFMSTEMCPVPDNLFTDDQLKLIHSAENRAKIDRPNCFEFWLNRYQASIAAGIALFAGWLAWRGVLKQVRKADEQLKILRHQILSEVAEKLSASISYASSIFNRMTQVVESWTIIRKGVEEMNVLASEAIAMVDRGDRTYRQKVSEISSTVYRIQMAQRNIYQADKDSAILLEKRILHTTLHQGVLDFFENANKCNNYYSDVVIAANALASKSVDYDMDVKASAMSILEFIGELDVRNAQLYMDQYNNLRNFLEREARKREIYASEAETLFQ